MPSITALPRDVLDQITSAMLHIGHYLYLVSAGMRSLSPGCICRHLHIAAKACSPGILLALCYRSRHVPLFWPGSQFLSLRTHPTDRVMYSFFAWEVQHTSPFYDPYDVTPIYPFWDVLGLWTSALMLYKRKP
jgi:hypothetical protein